MNFFSWFTIAGIKPNLFIILVLMIGLFAGKIPGITCGIIEGLLLDFFIGKSVRNNCNNAWYSRIFRRIFR